MVKMKLYAYVVGASSNPDAIECVVPYKVNDEIIFFGPCKKRLRKNFYKKYLKHSEEGEVNVKEDLYLLGLNAYNPKKVRKIVWVGKIWKILTYEKANKIFSSNKNEFKEMIEKEKSPLNLEPIYNSGKFKGYKLRSKEHLENDSWVKDVIDSKENPRVNLTDKTIKLKESDNRNEIFTKDCVLLCKNIFFAEGKGIDIDEEIVNLFKKVQPNEGEIDDYAIFGRQSNDNAKGLRGNFLEIQNEKTVKKLIKKIKQIGNELQRKKEYKSRKRKSCQS
ncbi:MAG: hypothetical protein ACOC44_20035 [Promethearchaeia archaeon]